MPKRAPKRGGNSAAPYYVVYVERRGENATQTETDGITLSNALDKELSLANFSYQTYREKGSIAPPRVRFVAPGTFAELRRALVESGQMSANQMKMPRVLKSPEHIGGLQSRVVSKSALADTGRGNY